MSENGITRYCLGNGDLKCDGCQQEKNWQTLNKMPDTLRKSLQAQAQRIDDTDCILSGRPWYVGAVTHKVTRRASARSLLTAVLAVFLRKHDG